MKQLDIKATFLSKYGGRILEGKGLFRRDVWVVHKPPQNTRRQRAKQKIERAFQAAHRFMLRQLLLPREKRLLQA